MAQYYSISNSKGKFYLKSKQPKEGFEKVTYGTENKVTYHKYVDTLTGTLEKFEQRDVDTADGKKLKFAEFVLKDGNDLIVVSAPLKRQNGNFSDEAITMLSALNSADFGEEVTARLYKKDDKYLSLYINYVNRKDSEGKNMSTGFIPFSEIPRAIKEEDEDLGVTWDWKPVQRFWAKVLKSVEERSKSRVSDPLSQPAKKNDEPDDLPF